MTRRYLSLALLAPLVTLLAVRGPAASSPVCSIVPFPVDRDSQTTVFIGRAVAETLYAGAGGVRYSVRGGHWSANRNDRRIFGQRIDVLRLGGAGAPALDTLFARRADSSVVVVPWDYDPGCETTLWGRSFLWTMPESVGVFTVILRPRENWAAALPTFDAFKADIEPYPHGIFYQEGYGGTGAVRQGGGLSVSEFFDFYLALPPFYGYGSDSLQYRKIICDWAAAHPQQALRFPASRLVSWQRC